MKNMFRRGLAMLLVVVMAFGLMGQALAADSTGTDYENHWAAEYIDAMRDAGYVSGDPDGSFRPNSEVTRAEFMKMVDLMAGLDGTSDQIGNFTDVKEGKWYYKYVNAALAAGYVKGTSATKMSPNGSILRQDAMTMLGRLLNLSTDDYSSLEKFTDAGKISGYAKSYMAALVEAGVIGGSKHSDGTYTVDPKATMTRGEAMKMLWCARELFATDDSVTTWADLYAGMGVDTTEGYDAVTSATNFTSFHANSVPTIVSKTTAEDGTVSLDGVVLTGTEATVAVSGTASYTSSRYGDAEFAVTMASEDEAYVWNDYLANLYAVTISDGTTTVGAMPWIDYYGESATSGAHYNKVEIALNNGTSVASNEAEVTRYAAFYNEDGTIKAGTYTITLYSEGFETVTCTAVALATYAGTITAEAVTQADTEITLTGLPEDAENATATVSYSVLKEGERRPTTVTVASAVAVADGKISGLDLSAVPAGSLSITVNSDNYMPISVSCTVSEVLYYVTMNVPYADFYAAENAGEQVDVVTTATTSKFKGTTGLALGTYNDGTNICGVSCVVAMNAATYAALAENKLEPTVTTDEEGNEVSTLDLGTAADYAFVDYEGTPAAYKTLSYADGVYTFSALTGEQKDATALGVTDYTTSGGYGDYQISLEGVLTSGMTINGESTVIYGAILTTSDDATYAMYALNNLWYGTRVTNVELAWSVKNGQGICAAHGSGPMFYQYDMNGKTLTNVRLLTSLGIYDIACELKLDEYYAGEEAVSAEFTDANTLAVSVPAAFEDVTVSVSYRNGRATAYLIQDAAIVDGVVTLETAAAADVTYTVTVNSSNYAPVSVTAALGAVDTGITEEQKTALNALIATGSELVEQLPDDTATLAAHVQEAKDMLANEEATSDAATELIGELESLIAEAQAKLPAEPVVETYTGTATVYDVDEDFENYQITATVTVTDGVITAIAIATGDGYDEGNDKYLGWAEDGRTTKKGEFAGVKSQLIDKTAAEVAGLSMDVEGGIDAVSGATCSSSAILAAVQAALAA